MTSDPISGPALADILRDLRDELYWPTVKREMEAASEEGLTYTESQQPEAVRRRWERVNRIVAADLVCEALWRCEARWRGEDPPEFRDHGDNRISFNLPVLNRPGGWKMVLDHIMDCLQEGNVTIRPVRREDLD